MSEIESDNALLAARSFRIVGIIVFLFQFLYLVADHFTMPEYERSFLPLYAINGVDGLCAVVVTRTGWFARYWKFLALAQVGLLDATGTIMNIFSGTVTPQFYIIITFSFGCATFLPWGVTWQSALNLFCLASYVLVCLNATVAERYLYYQWITLIAVLILSEFPAHFIDSYRRNVFRQLKASRDKSEFLASMSHEMRTPLNTIIGMIEVLEGTAIKPEQSKYLNICRASGDALIALINDIVDIARIEAGELHLHQTEFDLYELTDHLADAFALSAHRKGLDLVFNVIHGTPTRLIGDPMRLRQVCSNLLVNAIKFTDKGQVIMRVETVGARDAGVLRFCVADTGVGIAPEEQTRIFSRFARIASVPAGQEGSGLGLEISKRLVEAMGGRIWVESVLGIGSTFYFTCRLGIRSVAENEASAKLRLWGTKVLVVDDNIAHRSAIGEMLNSAGASVSLCSASQVRHELSAAHRNHAQYTAILLDARIQQDVGIELERDPLHRDRTIIMVARNERPVATHAADATSLGRYLLKPVKRTELIDAVSSLTIKRQSKAMDVHTEAGSLLEQRQQGCKILLAEDSEENRLLIAAYLRGTSHQLETAENGRIAVEMFKVNHYDLLLIDVNMPVMDGFSAVASMRAWEREQGTSPTPIIALTGRAMVEDRMRAIEAGCNGYLTKPLRRAVLMEAISRFTDNPGAATK
ncbi:MAG TPA: response regulator [Candidatus Binataceae bacterium]|nr:response regulator [Candidatus Binataceae bacterium]